MTSTSWRTTTSLNFLLGMQGERGLEPDPGPAGGGDSGCGCGSFGVLRMASRKRCGRVVRSFGSVAGSRGGSLADLGVVLHAVEHALAVGGVALDQRRDDGGGSRDAGIATVGRR